MKQSSANEFADGSAKMGFINSTSKYNANQLSKAGKQEISFGSVRQKRFTKSNAKRFFQGKDSSFNKNAIFGLCFCIGDVLIIAQKWRKISSFFKLKNYLLLGFLSFAID